MFCHPFPSRLGETNQKISQRNSANQFFLDPNSQYVVGLNRIINMSFTWYNINAALKNQLIKFSSDGGETFSDITFPAGVWDYSSLNEAIQNATGKVGDKFPINLGFSLTTFRVTITLETNWQLDLTPSNFGNLIGFDKKILKDKLNIGPRVPNLSQDTDMLNVHCDLTNDSLVDGGRKRYHLLLFHICSAGLL